MDALFVCLSFRSFLWSCCCSFTSSSSSSFYDDAMKKSHGHVSLFNFSVLRHPLSPSYFSSRFSKNERFR